MVVGFQGNVVIPQTFKQMDSVNFSKDMMSYLSMYIVPFKVTRFEFDCRVEWIQG